MLTAPIPLARGRGPLYARGKRPLRNTYTLMRLLLNQVFWLDDATQSERLS
jgi:hypothetical protein